MKHIGQDIDTEIYMELLNIYKIICDGRAFLAREKLEELLGIETKDAA